MLGCTRQPLMGSEPEPTLTDSNAAHARHEAKGLIKNLY
jgi:hypothetical protein